MTRKLNESYERARKTTRACPVDVSASLNLDVNHFIVNLNACLL